MEMKAALLQNDEICYGSLGYFLKQIESSLNRQGIQTEVVTEIDDSFMENTWAAVIGINQETLSARLENGDFVFDYLNCPLFCMIVDPPWHHDRILRTHPHNMHLICMDEGHAIYGQTYYGPFQSVKMGYVLGGWQESVSWKDREIDVLFTGTHTDLEEIRNKVYRYSQTWVRELFEYLIESGRLCPRLSTEKAMQFYFNREGMKLSREDFKMAMAICGTYAEFYLRGYYRERVIETLLDAGIPLNVVGNGWEKFGQRYPHNLVLGDSVDFSETAGLTAHAKIALNVMPWFKDGLHDRIPTAMYNKAVCVTDSSSYIDTHFQDGKDIVLYDLEQLNALPDKVRNLLKQPELAEEIADNGYLNAQQNYTWDKMVAECIVSHIL